MALPTRIELKTGAGYQVFLGLWLLWLTALASVAAHAARMPVWLLLASAGLLFGSVPGKFATGLQTRRLMLYSNGLAQWGEEQGLWQANTWRSRIFTAIRLQSGQRRSYVWIDSRSNHPDAYRQLGIWCRFSPQQPGLDVNDSH